jgi:hypothetical protein
VEVSYVSDCWQCSSSSGCHPAGFWHQLTWISLSFFRLFSERNLSMLFTSANQLTQMNMPELQCQEVVEPPAIVTVTNWTA